MSISDVLDTFEFLDDWEERYKYLIDLGRKLPEMDGADKIEENRVHGCTSRVWLTHHMKDGQVIFNGESDAHIVRGLVSLLLMIYSDKTPDEIISTDAKAILNQLGLEKHLSPMRTNGLFSMMEKIKSIAATYKN
ncbi:MAG: cysteine desulfuration protein SufE [Kordiimonas sp.]|nr:cysteine desulfuration protein SufE [Kordiimonas sp.]|tara:strand:+ start:1544 stop:1948 length:405 start_codon:yes stop_codon:yes gene_type:complete